jgi:hypothetical protein
MSQLKSSGRGQGRKARMGGAQLNLLYIYISRVENPGLIAKARFCRRTLKPQGLEALQENPNP